MIKALCLALLLIAPFVLSQRGGRGGGGNQGYSIPQNWVDNNRPSCGNINNLINQANNNLNTINSRINDINNAISLISRQYSSLTRFCRVRYPTRYTRRNIQGTIFAINSIAQPLIDDRAQRRYFNLNRYYNNRDPLRVICINVEDSVQELINYFQWLTNALAQYYTGPGGVITNRLATLNSYKKTCLCPGNYNLCIVGAAWGTAQVTSLVQGLVNGQSLNLLAAENPLPGGSKPNGYLRSLVVIYQQGNSRPQVAIAQEGSTLSIGPGGSGGSWNGPIPGQLNILGAAWGLQDVTSNLANRVSGGSLTINPNINVLGDSWPNQQKTLVISYWNNAGIRLADYVEVYDGSSYTIS